ncbi:MAG: hypothetical protein ACKOQ6_02355 [Bacteroidota bacterium]
MLKESLQDLIKNQRNPRSRDCKVGKIICSQDEETQELLIQTLRGDEMPTTSIVRLLKSEGLPVSREFLGAKRSECFRAEMVPSDCCIAEKLEAFKNDK